ncbi:MAG: 5'/3'-nucleotidase SurE, partial [Gammaproteobacteria bacterium]
SSTRPQILLTNDDGIQSPGLWAAAAALSELGYVTVTAPRDQCSGMGRSLPNTSDGIIHEQRVQVNGQEWTVYSVGGSPAQAVLHAILEVMPQKPDLVVSGINYGENVGLGITISGTIGAAMEAAALGYPALAVSLEAEPRYHLTYSDEINFSAAGYFAAYFARLMLAKSALSEEVNLLKVDVPSDATPETSWQVTRVARQRYYEPLPPERVSWDVAGKLTYKEAALVGKEDENTDVSVLRRKRLVSVTPLSLDMTARVDLGEFENSLRKSESDADREAR